MLLLFRSGWLHLLFGLVFLSGAVALLGYAEGNVGRMYSFLDETERFDLGIAGYVIQGVFGHLAILLAFTFVGTAVAPRNFLRSWFSSLARIYGRSSHLRAFCLGLMAALLIEPLFRLGLQPMLMRELQPYPAVFLLAGIVAAASWIPFANLLALAAFFESLWFSYLFLKTATPWVPVLSHGISEWALAITVLKMEKMGLRASPPPSPEDG